MRLAQERKVQELAEYLTGLLQRLADGGAELATIPAFSPQICAAELAELTPLPLVNLLDVIASEAARRKLRRVAVFGARVTMETGLFGKLPDCDVIGLSREETNLVSDIYLRVIEAAKASAEEYEQLRSLAHRVIERENLDAIVLAGTDLAFVFNERKHRFPASGWRTCPHQGHHGRHSQLRFWRRPEIAICSLVLGRPQCSICEDAAPLSLHRILL